MSEKHEEWLKQADYDMDTADAMFSSGRLKRSRKK
jgi:HEPN domain-containing protein